MYEGVSGCLVVLDGWIDGDGWTDDCCMLKQQIGETRGGTGLDR